MEVKPASKRSFRAGLQWLLDKLEPLAVGLIYLSGWSAIFFVLTIFIFVFGAFAWAALTFLRHGTR